MLLTNRKISATELQGGSSIYILRSDEVSYSSLNSLVQIAGGLINVLLPRSIVEKFDIPILGKNRAGWIALESVEAKEGVSTGISTGDRLITITKLINQDSVRDDISMPGHVFPILFDKEECENCRSISSEFENDLPLVFCYNSSFS